MNACLNIRPAVVAEYERLSVLWKGVEHQHYQALPHIFRKPDEGPARSVLASLIVGPDSTILVAETDNEIAGFVALKVYRIEQTPRMRGRRFVIIEIWPLILAVAVAGSGARF